VRVDPDERGWKQAEETVFQKKPPVFLLAVFFEKINDSIND
jgi:hypothetical protein